LVLRITDNSITHFAATNNRTAVPPHIADFTATGYSAKFPTAKHKDNSKSPRRPTIPALFCQEEGILQFSTTYAIT
jgi:hypothetical protein